MIKETKYNGYTAVPSDYECADGDLATAVNLVPEDGALKPVLPPKVLFSLDSTQNVVFVHSTAKYTHYIVYDDNPDIMSFYWTDGTTTSDGKAKLTAIGSHLGYLQTNAVGNTLIFLTENYIQYYLWIDGAYKHLGDHLPNIEISFGLRGYPRFFSTSDDSKAVFKVNFDKKTFEDAFDSWEEDMQTQVTSQIMAKLNKFLAEQTVNKGRFALPFLLRYALRLYDGSLVCHSAPILLNPSTAGPVVYIDKYGITTFKGDISYFKCDIMLVAADICYKVIQYRSTDDSSGNSTNDYATMMSNWTDIIKSVDIFITKPLYPYDQSGKCKTTALTSENDSVFVGAIMPTGTATSAKEDCLLCPSGSSISVDGTAATASNGQTLFKDIFTEWGYGDLYALYLDSSRKYPQLKIALPKLADDDGANSIASASQFFRLASIDLADLPTSDYTKLDVDDEYLQSIVNREVMTDDYLTHDRLIATRSHAYNSRLNLTGVKRKLFRGFCPHSMFAYKKYAMSGMNISSDAKTVTFSKTAFPPSTSHTVYVYIKEGNKVYCAQSSINGVQLAKIPTGTQVWGAYVYYPNANAFRMIISDGITSKHYELKTHEMLNGAFCFTGYDPTFTGVVYPKVTDTTNIVDAPSKIYTSEVNNPFYFPVSGINTVGTGTILGISTASKALSQGQFGQFPLYAFSTDGVWALEVSSTGSYSAKQPVTRDVCINPDSITQMDSSVLFATDRGIMQISGSNTACLTDAIITQYPFDINDLPNSKGLVTVFNDGITDTAGQLSKSQITLLPFLTFLKSCRMAYDYIRQRVILYNPSCAYAYVMNMGSRQWGMMQSKITSHVNAYPNAYAMDSGNNFVDVSASGVETTRVLAVTRPFKFGEPDVFKTIDTIIQRGRFDKDHLGQVLYASNNLLDWHLVWSSKGQYLCGFRGTPYKHFRLVLVGSLSASESIYGFTTQLTPRITNRPR